MKEKLHPTDWRIVCTAIIAVAVMETTALLTKTDGALFGIAIAAIAGLGGFVVRLVKPGA